MYTALNPAKRQIRLLQLQPGSGDTIVEASLMVVSLPDQSALINPKWVLKGHRHEDLNEQQYELPSQMEALRVSSKAEPAAETMHDDFESLVQLEESSSQNNARVPKYEAVSYCWSDSAVKATLLLDGVPFDAPSSAVEALHALRLHDLARILWLDALCINQQDADERGQQVAIMGSIYASSAKTTIYLGSNVDSSRTKRALELCSIIAQQVSNSRHPSELLGMSDDAQTLAAGHVVIPNGYEVSLLDDIFARRWFRRLWVVQEAALSPFCVCQLGELTMPWGDILMTALWAIAICDFDHTASEQMMRMGNEAGLGTTLPGLVGRYMHHIDQRGKVMDLHFLVFSASYCEAMDPRDKIFGLLGMTKWSLSGLSLPAGIKPDYTKSLRDCVRDATRVMIVEIQNLLPLTTAEVGVEGWPSWTPNWRFKEGHGKGRNMHCLPFQTTVGHPLNIGQVIDNDNPDILLLDGHKIDTIKTSFTIPPHFCNSLRKAPISFQILYRAFSRVIQATPMKLLRTLMLGRNKEERFDEMDPDIQNFLDYLMAGYKPAEASDPMDFGSFFSNDEGLNEIDSKTRDTSLGFEHSLRSLSRELYDSSSGGKLLVTRAGRAVSGTKTVRKKDIVVVLFGGNCPFILRKEEGHYILVGPCYVDGVTDDEAVKELENRRDPQTFSIH